MSKPVKLSVIVPTCDRPETLARCLGALNPNVQMVAPESFEVIVTNDGTNDLAVGYSWARVTPGPRRGPAANRNHGARLATGGWLVFLDDDCVPGAQWLAEYQRAASSDQFDFLEGRVDAPGWTGHPLEERVENQRGGVFWSCNIAVRRALFESAGGFDEEFRQAAFEDMEFAARLKRLGARTAFVSGARVEHPVRRLSFAQLWRRRLMLRWYALYLRKTETPRSLAKVLLLNLLHGIRREFGRERGGSWQRAIFNAAWELATFPVVLPYVLLWDRRFQRTRA